MPLQGDGGDAAGFVTEMSRCPAAPKRHDVRHAERDGEFE